MEKKDPCGFAFPSACGSPASALAPRKQPLRKDLQEPLSPRLGSAKQTPCGQPGLRVRGCQCDRRREAGGRAGDAPQSTSCWGSQIKDTHCWRPGGPSPGPLLPGAPGVSTRGCTGNLRLTATTTRPAPAQATPHTDMGVSGFPRDACKGVWTFS